MHEFLEKYVILKKDDRVSKYDNEHLRSLEETLRKNPDDTECIKALTEQQKKLMSAYRSMFEGRN